MPYYDYRCNACGNDVSIFYKNYHAFDRAQADSSHTCPVCGAQDLTRLISRVALPNTEHHFGQMNSQEMLSVLESGKAQDVQALYKQVGQDQVLNNPVNQSGVEQLIQKNRETPAPKKPTSTDSKPSA